MVHSERRSPTNSSRRAILALTVAACALAGTAPSRASESTPAAEVLTLERAVSLALEGNRDVRNAALEVVKAESELGAFKTKALPYFNLYVLESQTHDSVNADFPSAAL